VERHTTRSRPRRAAGARPTLEAAGRRSTPQREAVYRYLAGVDHHPTAEEVYLAVKRRVPRVSLATVYTALEVLVRSGLASKLTYGDAAARYDVRTDAHSHARCLVCGRVRDLELVPDAGWVRTLRTPGFESTGFRFELIGRCATCRRG
jgi:Fur family transcriptional regulator, peroxide stress response regulator